MFIKDGLFDFDMLVKITRIVTRNLDIIIDKNSYPPTGDDKVEIDIPKQILESDNIDSIKQFLKNIQENPKDYIKPINRAKLSSMRHRPIGIGVQGLADVFILLGLPFESEEAKQLNRDIFETIYYAALCESVQLSKEKGSYKSYHGSPISRGIYQFHMWNVTPSKRWNWEALDKERQKYGLRNSLVVAPMPTKSTAHILVNNEAFEPYHSMIFKARVLAGEFDLINKHLIRILKSRGLWNKSMMEKIIANRGSVQNVEGFPEDLKPIFKTVWEIKMKNIIDMAADRGAFVDQSQSMNLWLPDADEDKIASMITYAWKKGLKTLCYYLHIRTAAESLAYTVSPEMLKKELENNEDEEEYNVTTTLDQKSLLNTEINPICPIDYEEDEELQGEKRKREDEDEEIVNTCPYDAKNPLKKTCVRCTS